MFFLSPKIQDPYAQFYTEIGNKVFTFASSIISVAKWIFVFIAEVPIGYELILKDNTIEYRALTTSGFKACNLIGFTEFVMR